MYGLRTIWLDLCRSCMGVLAGGANWKGRECL